jgi:pilus assembly protein CpaE
MLDSSGPLVMPEPNMPAHVESSPAAARLGQQRILAFVNDDASAAALEGGLAGIAVPFEVRRGGVRHCQRFLEKETDGVHALVVDIAGTDDPLRALEDLARVCPPDVLMTAIGDSTDIGFYRTLVNGMGVREYLPKPLTRNSVQTVLRPQLVGEEPASSAERGGHLVAICGAQGGAGTTSITVNLAIQLAETTKASVAILDLHLQDGEAAVMLGVRPGPGLRIALEDPLRADALFLERTAIEVAPRVRLISADEALEDQLEITEAGVRHVLALLRRKFNFVLVDLPVPLHPAMRPVIGGAHHVLVLLEAEVTGLRNAAGLRSLVARIAGSNRMFTVLNRAGRPGGLPVEAVKKGLGAAPDVIIPDLGRRMTQAVNSGVPAIKKIPALRRHLAPLVREIAGIRVERSRFFLARWFGR